VRVTSLRVYPVKSMGGVAIEVADVEPWGIAGDRRWGLVDESGQKITAREIHDLLRFRAEIAGEQTIRISDRDGASVLAAAPVGGASVPVSHSRQGRALLAAAEVNSWLSERIGVAARLVWQHDPTVRTIGEDDGGKPGDSLSLADAGPLLLASEASMAQLNAWIAADAELPDVPDIDPSDLSAGTGSARGLDILRFRPNVIIDGDEPFAEDGWPTVRIGAVEFRTTVLCDRCVMTTIDPITLAGGKEPIRTLARHRRWDRKTWFGTRLAPRRAGTISVGDTVEPGR
jgi:MOSC domain-containing protein